MHRSELAPPADMPSSDHRDPRRLGRIAAIRHIAFVTPGNYPEDDPGTGLEAALRLFERGEALGFDSAWVRSRHLERAISSAATFLAAASQRTRRIRLGTAVIQLGYENPFRLAEDLATVDLLSKGRLEVGVSAGAPTHGWLLGDRLFEGDPAAMDFSYDRALRLRDNLSGAYLGRAHQLILSPAGEHRARLQPHSPTLTQRLWYGGGSLRSAEWAGRNGFNLLIGNLNQGEESDAFFETQQRHIEIFRAAWSLPTPPRIALGRVIVPTDSADASTRRLYAAFAESRRARTLAPQGARRTLFARDLVGTAEQILEQLAQDPILPQVTELRLELPYDLALGHYEQILTDFSGRIAPEIGWSASSG
jgi:alkanesulfonate monooxygenase SsuD/methylene tetrahydromethanopterin reductase-like flavin-dependent oxidoreductase (luciferase family)